MAKLFISTEMLLKNVILANFIEVLEVKIQGFSRTSEDLICF